jgi:hypothetical protein
MQIRGGRGYETAGSLGARDEDAEPVERFFRDSRINTIFEGSTEIMRLFIAREALDPHLKIAGAMFNSQLPRRARLVALLKAASFYVRWYPALFVPRRFNVQRSTLNVQPALRSHLRFVEHRSRKLARSLFHAMLRHGPKLEREQLVLGRFVDIGGELFTMSAACARAITNGDSASLALVNAFCCDARVRIDVQLRSEGRNADGALRRAAKALLENQFAEVLGVPLPSRDRTKEVVELPRQAA